MTKLALSTIMAAVVVTGALAQPDERDGELAGSFHAASQRRIEVAYRLQDIHEVLRSKYMS